jgi:hypothetical protein
MAQAANSFLSNLDMFSQRFRDFINDPITNWSRFISPSVNFGVNIEDAPVEEQVLNGVGSYGKQINRINDALTVLLLRLDRQSLTPLEAEAVRQFESMAARADEYSSRAQDEAQSPLYAMTRPEIAQMIERCVRAHVQQEIAKLKEPPQKPAAH